MGFKLFHNYFLHTRDTTLSTAQIRSGGDDCSGRSSGNGCSEVGGGGGGGAVHTSVIIPDLISRNVTCIFVLPYYLHLFPLFCTSFLL